jgi:nucleotide-binding universal stress UspA family protein
MMFNRVLLALDRTASAWRALPAAEDLSARIGAPLELVHVTDHQWTTQDARADLEAGWIHRRAGSAPPRVAVLVEYGSTVHTLARHAAEVPGTLLVMATSGHGRSEVVLGSVTLDVLAATHGPIVAVGHHADVDLGDELVIPVDGSPHSAVAVTLGAAMASTLGLRPWVVTNVEEAGWRLDDVQESNEPHHMAERVAALTGQEAEYEVLHGKHSGAAVADFARSIGARMIVCSSHGRTGWGRLALGSVGAEIVRRARCPVTLIRPAALPSVRGGEITAMTTATPTGS